MKKADEIGLVRPGYRADLVLINLTDTAYRPLNSAVKQLVFGESGKGVDTVIVDGRVVVEKGRLTTISEAQLHRSAEAWRAELSVESMRISKRNAGFLRDILAAYEEANRYPIEFDRFLLRQQ